MSLPNTTTQSGTTTTVSSVNVAAPMFQIIWQSSDMIGTTTSSSSLSASVATAGVSINGSSPAQTTAPVSAGLSSGQSIGIGVGVGVATILLVLALIFWIIRYRRRRLQRSSPETVQQPSIKYAQDVEKPRQELGPSLHWRTELPAKLRQGELGTDGEIVELG